MLSLIEVKLSSMYKNQHEVLLKCSGEFAYTMIILYLVLYCAWQYRHRSFIRTDISYDKSSNQSQMSIVLLSFTSLIH